MPKKYKKKSYCTEAIVMKLKSGIGNKEKLIPLYWALFTNKNRKR